MKFKKPNTYIESHFSDKNLHSHSKHLDQYANDDRFSNVMDDSDYIKMLVYDGIGDTLSRKRVGKSDSINDRYVGYINKDGRYVKYDRKTFDFVVYDNNNNKTITLHKKSKREYDRVRERDFAREFPYNEKEVEIKDIKDERN